MQTHTLLITGLILLPAVGVAAWLWFALGRVDAQLRDLGGFEGIHFEIGAPSARDAGGAR